MLPFAFPASTVSVCTGVPPRNIDVEISMLTVYSDFSYQCLCSAVLCGSMLIFAIFPSIKTQYPLSHDALAAKTHNPNAIEHSHPLSFKLALLCLMHTLLHCLSFLVLVLILDQPLIHNIRLFVRKAKASSSCQISGIALCVGAYTWV